MSKLFLNKVNYFGFLETWRFFEIEEGTVSTTTTTTTHTRDSITVGLKKRRSAARYVCRASGSASSGTASCRGCRCGRAWRGSPACCSVSAGSLGTCPSRRRCCPCTRRPRSVCPDSERSQSGDGPSARVRISPSVRNLRARHRNVLGHCKNNGRLCFRSINTGEPRLCVIVMVPTNPKHLFQHLSLRN